MKDLNKNEVYDIRGITEKQAKEIQKHLIDIGVYWADRSLTLDYILTREYLIYKNGNLLHGKNDSKPTTHISTLFETSLEEQLYEAEIKVAELKKQIEERDKPKIGDVVKAWDGCENSSVVGFYGGSDSYHRLKGCDYGFENIKKITQQEVIELLFNEGR